VIGNKEKVEYDDLVKFQKLTAFMKECLRLRNPAASNIPRRATVNHYLKDIYIKKGTIKMKTDRLVCEEYSNYNACF